MEPSAGRTTTSIAERVAVGDERAIARAISLVEAGGERAALLLRQLRPVAGKAVLIGVTGPPGAGKSTLVGQLIISYRRAGLRTAVLAIDPSSPFTGGALLGDRVRMQAHADDRSVFIRSMATRGHLGGLSTATSDAAVVLDAAGFDIIVIETVGVGQDEIDIAGMADVCVLVTVPGAGDDVQAMKAGVMEIADIFVVNKADRDGADRAAAAIEAMLSLDAASGAPKKPVLRMVATTGEGVEALVEALETFRATDATGRRTRRLVRSERRLLDAIATGAVARARREAGTSADWDDLVGRIESGVEDPHGAADMLARTESSGAVDHVGVATSDAAASLSFFRDLLGLHVGPPEEVPSQGVRVTFLEAGDTRVELVEAVDEGAPFAASLRKRGPGLHHVAVRVPDLEATLARLSTAGVRLIDRAGRAGAHGTLVAFVHPASTGGVLVELVERKREQA
jgi:LAO/AO transport system kinase